MKMILFLAYLKCSWEKYVFGIGIQICSEVKKIYGWSWKKYMFGVGKG